MDFVYVDGVHIDHDTLILRPLLRPLVDYSRGSRVDPAGFTMEAVHLQQHNVRLDFDPSHLAADIDTFQQMYLMPMAAALVDDVLACWGPGQVLVTTQLPAPPGCVWSQHMHDSRVAIRCAGFVDLTPGTNVLMVSILAGFSGIASAPALARPPSYLPTTAESQMIGLLNEARGVWAGLLEQSQAEPDSLYNIHNRA